MEFNTDPIRSSLFSSLWQLGIWDGACTESWECRDNPLHTRIPLRQQLGKSILPVKALKSRQGVIAGEFKPGKEPAGIGEEEEEEEMGCGALVLGRSERGARGLKKGGARGGERRESAGKASHGPDHVWPRRDVWIRSCSKNTARSHHGCRREPAPPSAHRAPGWDPGLGLPSPWSI